MIDETGQGAEEGNLSSRLELDQPGEEQATEERTPTLILSRCANPGTSSATCLAIAYVRRAGTGYGRV